MLEHLDDADIGPPERVADAVRQLRGFERVAPDVEEVVVGAQLAVGEQVLPDGEQAPLGVGRRAGHGRALITPGRDRLLERATIDLAALAERRVSAWRDAAAAREVTIVLHSEGPVLSATDETIAEMRQIVARYPESRSALLPMLHLVQSVDGRISDAGVQACAELL